MYILNNTEISIGILAGGQSTRMGKNKAFLKYSGKRFIDRIVDEFKNFDDVIISSAQEGFYEDIGVRVVYDKHKKIGPIEGIYQILKCAVNQYVFICGADMPFIKSEVAEYLAEFISSDYDCLCITSENRTHPLCAVYSKAAFPVIKEMTESRNYRLTELLNNLRTKYIKLEFTCFEKRTVLNINTPEEYLANKPPAVFCVSGVKNSGKTTLIVKLIEKFVQLGYIVGVIKHDGHEYKMDYDNTDTYRFSEAGAAYSSIYSNTQYSLNARRTAKAETLIKLNDGADIIIIEGMKYSDYPKVEVVRNEISENTVCDEKTLICIASDVNLNTRCPIVPIDDISGIFQYIADYFGLF